MQSADFRIFDTLGNESFISSQCFPLGRWMSVGNSPLCDVECSFVSPDRNLFVSHWKSFVGIKCGREFVFAYSEVTCKVASGYSVCLSLNSERQTFDDIFARSEFDFYSSVYLRDFYEPLKEAVAFSFDSTLLRDASSERVLSEICSIVDGLKALFPMNPDSEIINYSSVVLALYAEFALEGPLTNCISNRNITEIVINGFGELWIECDGTWERGAFLFSEWSVFERWLLFQSAQANAELYSARGFTDFVMKCGARVHVSFPPAARSQAYVTIRTHREKCWRLVDLEELGFMSRFQFEVLTKAIKERCNVLLVGPTSSGKTTLLRALALECSPEERIVVMEDVPELRLEHPHVVYLQSHGHGVMPAISISLDDLVRESLRMRPDRIVVGECRGSESLSLLQALHTGHRGALCTLHGNSVADALDRFQALVMQAQGSLSADLVAKMIFSSIDLVVMMQRDKHGNRKICDIQRLSIEGLHDV